MIQASTAAPMRTADFWILRSVEWKFRNVGTELTFCARQNLIRVQISRLKLMLLLGFKIFIILSSASIYLQVCIYLFIYLGHYDK
jgi:hypothetical protein